MVKSLTRTTGRKPRKLRGGRKSSGFLSVVCRVKRRRKKGGSDPVPSQEDPPQRSDREATFWESREEEETFNAFPHEIYIKQRRKDSFVSLTPFPSEQYNSREVVEYFTQSQESQTLISIDTNTHTHMCRGHLISLSLRLSLVSPHARLRGVAF